MQLFWSVLLERNGMANDACASALLDVAIIAGRNGYTRIGFLSCPTDLARNKNVNKFMELSKDPNDILAMLDCDHKYPPDILERMATEIPPEYGVCGALAYRRGEPYDALLFVRGEDKELHSVANLALGNVYECDFVTTSAIFIRRWVFDKLIEKGFKKPFFRYAYNEDDSLHERPAEDTYFATICQQAGIKHYCHAGIEIPHLAYSFTDSKTNAEYYASNPPMIVDAPRDDTTEPQEIRC
jgi:hypothetical protein